MNVVKLKPNLDCNYTFPIDLTPNGIKFDIKSITIKIWFYISFRKRFICA